MSFDVMSSHLISLLQVRELIGVIQLKKYRTLRQRYNNIDIEQEMRREEEQMWKSVEQHMKQEQEQTQTNNNSGAT